MTSRHDDPHRFYERLGFAFVGHKRFGADDCSVYRLNRNACNACNAWRDVAEPT
ncbi:MAG: hypothetical protein WKF61_04705 [Luteimonas sp.]